MGSFPLTRGKQLVTAYNTRTGGLIPAHAGKTYARMDARRPIGLIPAHAGKTADGTRQSVIGGAHPRSRGENNRAVGTARTSSGSSPLTRGKRRGTIRRGLCAGLIPAHAGKTVPDWEHKALPGAHPRSRGENHRRSAPNGIKSGSSPLTRGKRAKVCPRHYRLRLIPAHAGKTFSEPLRRSRAWAHPRSRGENL